jgi:histidine phosphotransferase ChpT
MTTTDSPSLALEPLDLAAMLCSRVCHDVISPVGAIVNGLEVLEDETDASMRDVAIDLIKRSASGASAKLQFCRLAFGAAGSVGASIDTGDAESVARGLLETEKTALAWKAARQFLPKNKVKLLLNLCQIAGATIPRGGVIEVETTGEGEAAALRVAAKGTNARLQAGFADLLCGRPGAAKVDAHSIQPYFAGLVARECGMTISVDQEAEGFVFAAAPVQKAPQENAAAVETATP